MTVKTKLTPLDLSLSVPGMPGGGVWTITPTLISSGDTHYLVDTGMPGMMEDLTAQLSSAGVSLEMLSGVMITHQDIDHIGNLPQILEINPRVEVFAHPDDAPYIVGKLPLLKPLPKILEAFGANFSRNGIRIDHLVADGEELQVGGGFIVIHTPGHTPGHISLYHPDSKTLIAGDAMVVRGGQLHGPNEAQTPDLPEAYRSLAKLSAYDIRKIICYHGGVLDTDANSWISRLASREEED
ncbi:MBL fold metallo-hydrolase [Paenibacillus filicis]|uniref:MBL fold metallo-hydrolase n=1 Tax=Paenibacillus filicis TaxID=669464 RepID=A0ABU9DHQ8_9BACL